MEKVRAVQNRKIGSLSDFDRADLASEAEAAGRMESYGGKAFLNRHAHVKNPKLHDKR